MKEHTSQDQNLSESELNRYAQEVFVELEKIQQDEWQHNCKILIDNKIPEEEIEILLDGCCINGKFEIVDKPIGDDQDESSDFFDKIFVDQWQTGMEGDSFAGFIYGKFGDKKWIKIPYYC